MGDDYVLTNLIYSHGTTGADLECFRSHAVTFGWIRQVNVDTSGDRITIVILETDGRYHMPMMVTETSARNG